VGASSSPSDKKAAIEYANLKDVRWLHPTAIATRIFQASARRAVRMKFLRFDGLLDPKF
jgi:hypothetical protein